MYEAEEKALTRAKMHLMGKASTIFYTTILFSLKQEITDKVPTAAVDGYTLFLNPVFWMEQTPEKQIGLLVHEVLHVALDHPTRRGVKDPGRWNTAADHVINLSLIAAGYQLPDHGLWDSKYTGMSTEQVYAKLPKNPPANGGIGDDILYPDTQGKDSDTVREHITDIILRAATHAQMANSIPGSIPGEVMIALEKRLNPKLPWNVILQNYMSEFAKEDYTFSRPNRRFQPEFYLPTAHSEALCNIAVAVDCSGSVSDEEFNYFITEIDSIQQNMEPEKITVIDFDTQINSVQEITEGENVFDKLTFHGRGGTRISDLLRWAEKNQPTVLLVFTDGEFHQQPAPKGVPIIWLIHGDPSWSCSYGQVIHYDI
jgi:predicted metal-dependent peptidase